MNQKSMCVFIIKYVKTFLRVCISIGNTCLQLIRIVCIIHMNQNERPGAWNAYEVKCKNPLEQCSMYPSKFLTNGCMYLVYFPILYNYVLGVLKRFPRLNLLLFISHQKVMYHESWVGLDTFSYYGYSSVFSLFSSIPSKYALTVSNTDRTSSSLRSTGFSE